MSPPSIVRLSIWIDAFNAQIRSLNGIRCDNFSVMLCIALTIAGSAASSTPAFHAPGSGVVKQHLIIVSVVVGALADLRQNCQGTPGGDGLAVIAINQQRKTCGPPRQSPIAVAAVDPIAAAAIP